MAGREAKLSDLHRLIEEWDGVERDTFLWVANKYFESAKFNNLLVNTKNDYKLSHDIIASYPTKIGKPLCSIQISRWDNPLVQKLVDKLSVERGPTTAKHVHGFIRLVFRWGAHRGYCTGNPAIGTELPKERKRQRLPDAQAYDRLVSYAKVNGTYGQKKAGSCPHYIWAIMEIEYLCRLRGIECRNITDDHIRPEGFYVQRTKGSRDNLVEWNDRLRDAVNHLQLCRKEIWKLNIIPFPINATQRSLVVNTKGLPLERNAYQSAWGRFIRGCISRGTIEESERFSLHDLKRKGVTDTVGNQAEKQDASGHRDVRMLAVYDKSVPKVKPASE